MTAGYLSCLPTVFFFMFPGQAAEAILTGVPPQLPEFISTKFQQNKFGQPVRHHAQI